MKTILCFGDSNTWGYAPHQPRRYSINERWTALMQQHLGGEYHIVEEGLNSRTTVLDDPYEAGKNGLEYLLPCLGSHHPDLVIITLGTNDLKSRFNKSASDISKGAARLVQVAQNFTHDFMRSSPQVLLVSPPHVYESDPEREGFEGAEAKSKQFAKYYRKRADELGCHFLDAAEHITPCPNEGIHWQPEMHQKLAVVLADTVRKTL